MAVIVSIKLPLIIEDMNGKRFVQLSGFRYSLQTVNNSGERWRCVRHWDGCRAVCYISDNTLIKANTTHNHSRGVQRKKQIKSTIGLDVAAGFVLYEKTGKGEIVHKPFFKKIEELE